MNYIARQRRYEYKKRHSLGIKENASMLHAKNFSALFGHVYDGKQFTNDSGKIFTLKNHIKGWMIHGEDGNAITGYLTSAHDVEYYVVNGLGVN